MEVSRPTSCPKTRCCQIQLSVAVTLSSQVLQTSKGADPRRSPGTCPTDARPSSGSGFLFST